MRSTRIVQLSTAILVLLSLLLLGFVGYNSFLRFFYPFEFSKMEGCFVDHVRRVASGQPLYVTPTAEWVPLLYMPLTHYAGGWISRLGVDGLQAARLVSILSIFGSALTGMWLVARATGRSPLFAMVPVLIASTYIDVDCFYDQARPDNLMTLFCLLSVAMLTIRKRGLGVGLFVLFAVLAFFAKQSVFVFYAAFLIVLLFVHWRIAVLCGVLVSIVGAASFFVCDWMTDGWLRIYTFMTAASHDLDHRRLIDWIANEFLGNLAVPSFAIAAASIGLLFRRLARNRSTSHADWTYDVLLAAAVGAAGYSVASSWQHMAVRNVLILYAVVGMVFLPAAIHRALSLFNGSSNEHVARTVGIVLLCLVVLRGVQDTSKYVPTDADARDWEQFRAKLLSYGPKENAWVPLHGSVWGSGRDAPAYVHIAPLSDYVGGYFGDATGFRIPKELLTRIEEQWYSVVVLAGWDDRVKSLIRDHYMPDPNEKPFRLPAFSGQRGGLEEYWIPKDPG